jgi:ligand-binding SRPBCC domain-containing protein
MILINDVQYVSPLAQVKGMLKGERKYANVSAMHRARPFTTTAKPAEATA